MVLSRRNSWDDKQYVCDLTKFLDELCGIPKDRDYPFENYLLDIRDHYDNGFAIRVPGRTTGVVEIANDGQIIKCKIHDEVIGDGKFYPKDVNKKTQKYIGSVIEM